MKAKTLGAMLLAVLVVILVFAAVAQAAVSQSTINAILKDAQDGTIDGSWSAAQIQAALTYIHDNPTLEQYSDLEGVLSDFLSSSQAPGEQSGQLAFTGSAILLILGAGTGLIASGALLRRRSRA
jgi:predicted PurR-regulated permease PerM